MALTKIRDPLTKSVFTNLIKWGGMPLEVKVDRHGFSFEKSPRKLAFSCAILFIFNVLPFLINFLCVYMVFGKSILDVLWVFSKKNEVTKSFAFLFWPFFNFSNTWRDLGLTLTDTISLMLINLLLYLTSFRTLFHMYLNPKSVTSISRYGMTLGHIVDSETKKLTMIRTLKKIAFLLSWQIMLPFCFSYLFLVVLEEYDKESNWK